MSRHTILILLLVLSSFACTKEDIGSPARIVPATTAEDPALPRLLINGAPLHLETFGDIHDPIMIMLHGGPGFDYRAMISAPGALASRYPDRRQGAGHGLSALQDDFFLVFYDRRGSGLSPRFDPGAVRFDDQLADLRAIAEHFLEMKNQATGAAESRVYLFGWSFGGYLATAFTNEHPALVEGLILYEPRPFNQELFDLLDLTSPFAQLTEDYVDGVFTGSTYVVNTGHAAADYQWAVGATGDFSPEFHNPDAMPFWRVGFQVNQDIEREITDADRNVVDRLGAFAGNTLFMYGALTERDAIQPGYIEQITSFFPRVTTQRIDNTGHYGPWEEPGQLIAAIRRFTP